MYFFSFQFEGFKLAQNNLAGFEHLLDYTDPAVWYTAQGQVVKDSCVIAHMNAANSHPGTRIGSVLPFSCGLLYDGITYVNFDGTFKHGE